MKQSIQKLIAIFFGWEVWGYSSYSLNITPSDFHLFCFFRHHLDGKYYNDNEVMKTAVTYSYRSARVRAWPGRHMRCNFFNRPERAAK